MNPVPLHQIADTTIQNARNLSESVVLNTLWDEKPCALFFLRRLGCALCRSYISKIERIRGDLEASGARLVCLSFEKLGEGSDFDRSFEKGGFWNGELYTIDKSVVQRLFGRKGFFNGFYGLLDMDKKAYEEAKAVPGNFKGDGFQLGGQFVVAKGGRILLDHRQERYGDDATFEEISNALTVALADHKIEYSVL